MGHHEADILPVAGLTEMRMLVKKASRLTTLIYRVLFVAYAFVLGMIMFSDKITSYVQSLMRLAGS